MVLEVSDGILKDNQAEHSKWEENTRKLQKVQNNHSLALARKIGSGVTCCEDDVSSLLQKSRRRGQRVDNVSAAQMRRKISRRKDHGYARFQSSWMSSRHGVYAASGEEENSQMVCTVQIVVVMNPCRGYKEKK